MSKYDWAHRLRNDDIPLSMKDMALEMFNCKTSGNERAFEELLKEFFRIVIKREL